MLPELRAAIQETTNAAKLEERARLAGQAPSRTGVITGGSSLNRSPGLNYCPLPACGVGQFLAAVAGGA